MSAASKLVRLHVDGRAVEVADGASVAAAIAQVAAAFGLGTSGRARAPLCGMGVCFECRVSIDGVDQQRACMALARDGMRVCTALGASRD
jgi:predicted molibdopterin-dependent oxidoreductase YjgC